MPSINPNYPLQKTTDITKKLRSRDTDATTTTPLSQLLPLAVQVLEGGAGVNIYFPRKEEWLLEWIVQRLREEGGVEGVNARTDSKFWDLLLRLLRATTTSSLGNTAGVLKKHNFLQLIGKTLEDAVGQFNAAVVVVAVPGNQNLDADIDGDIEMSDNDVFSTPKEMLSSASSSTIISPSPATISASSSLSRLVELLGSVCKVIAFVRGGFNVDRRGNSVVAVLRGAPEVGAEILGCYLRIMRILVDQGERVDEEWTGSINSLWKGCVWGNSNAKKVSTLFSSSCLSPSVALLSNPSTPDHLRNVLEVLVAENIFSSGILFPPATGSARTKSTSVSSKELKQLLEVLRKSPEALTPESGRGGLAELFKIGITSQTRKGGSSLVPEVVETLFTALIESVLGVTLSEPPSSSSNTASDGAAEQITSLLKVLVETGTSISSEILAATIDLISNLSSSSLLPVQWSIIEMVLKLDFDTFLGRGKDDKLSSLLSAITAADVIGTRDQPVFEVLKLLIGGFVKARDLEGFVTHWKEQLAKSRTTGRDRPSIWETDALAHLFASVLEKSLQPTQISRLLRNLRESKDWVIMNAVLEGVNREETEDRVRPQLPELVTHILENPDCSWRDWRIIVRAAEIDSSVLTGGGGDNVVEKALGVLKEMDNITHDEGYRRVVMAFEISMRAGELDASRYQINLELAISTATQAIKTSTGSWNGSIEEVGAQNFGVAMMVGTIGRWLSVFEKARAETREAWVDEFVKTAIRDRPSEGNRTDISMRSIWNVMLQQEDFYENLGLKDAALSALITQLAPYHTLASNLHKSQEQVVKGTHHQPPTEEDLDRYEFVCDSIVMYPLEATKRGAREKILDSLFLLDEKLGVYNDTLGDGLRKKVRNVVERLWSVGNASSFLASGAEAFASWFLHGFDAEITGRKILRNAFVTKAQDRSQELLRSILQQTRRDYNSTESILEVNLGPLQLAVVVVTEFWPHKEDLTINHRGEVELLRETVMARLAKNIFEYSGEGKWIQEYVRRWTELYKLDKENMLETEEARKITNKLMSNLAPLLPDVLGTVTPSKDIAQIAKVVTRCLILQCVYPHDAQSAINTTALAVALLDSPCFNERDSVLKSYDCFVEALDAQCFKVVIESVVEACFPATAEVGEGYWDVLRSLVKGAKKPEQEEYKILVDCMSTVYSRMTMNLTKIPTLSGFKAVAECLDIILREKSWAVLQYNIDETLSSISISASPSGPHISPPSPDDLFLPLTRLVSAILILHRQRISGRYHLITALFQSLLHCLFTPNLTNRKRSDKQIHPPWLTTPISRKSATAYTRLLTTLCDPPTSSVTYSRSSSSSSKDLVNSATVAAKKVVAAHVGFLLLEYVKTSVGYRLEIEVREELRQGIYALVGVMDREVVKGLNAGMDAPGRAVLKGVWEEWGRFGGEI